MVKYILEKSELLDTISKFESYYYSDNNEYKNFYLERIKKGTVFLMYQKENEFWFAPSRFIGYFKNSYEEHIQGYIDGRDTNIMITAILGHRPFSDVSLEKEFQKFCGRLGFFYNNKGSFGVQRKFWDLSKAKNTAPSRKRFFEIDIYDKNVITYNINVVKTYPILKSKPSASIKEKIKSSKEIVINGNVHLSSSSIINNFAYTKLPFELKYKRNGYLDFDFPNKEKLTKYQKLAIMSLCDRLMKEYIQSEISQ